MSEEFYSGEDMENAENEAAKAKEKKKKNKKVPAILAGGAVAIIFAVIAYWILLSVETASLSKYEKKTVYILNQNITKGKQITEPNIFSTKNVDASIVPEDAITSISSIKDTYAVCNLSANTVLTKGMFADIDEAENGDREIGFEISGLSGSINGTLRASDFIDMYIYNSDDNKKSDATPTYSKVYISAVYTADGVKIANNDTTSLAARFTIVVPKEEADKIINAYASSNTVIMATKWTNKALLEKDE